MLTGTLPTMTREEAEAAIERLGGKVVGLGQPEDDGYSWSARGRQQTRESPTLGVPMLTEDGIQRRL